MSVCFFNSLLTVEAYCSAFSNNFFSGKTSLPVKNSYLPTFPDEKAEILAFSLFKSY